MAISFNPQGASSIQQNLSRTTKSLGKSNEQLSSGKRINSASDDAAALAIVAGLETTTKQASRNISDGVSLAAVADGGLSQASEILTRQAELATQAANGTVSDDQRIALQAEFDELNKELTRISETTTFNGQQLLSGSGNTFSIQAGNDSSGNSQISISTPGVSSGSLNLSGANISTAAAAQSALDAVKQATSTVSSARGELGASVARLEVANSQIKTEEVNNQAAASQLRDADIAEVVSRRAADLIRRDSAVSVLVQANLSAETVLKLLR